MYTVIFLSLFILSLIEILTKCINTTIFKIIFFAMTLMLVFRYGQGADYVIYEHEYNIILLRDNLKTFILLKGDYLFWILMAVFKYLSIPFEVLVGIIALFSMKCLYKFITRHSKHKFISLFIFYCLFYVYFDTLFRQSIALSIVLCYVFEYVIEEKYSKAILFCIIASLFHQSALIVIVGILLLKFKVLSNKNILFISIFCVILSYFGVFEGFINVLPFSLRSRMMWYVHSQGNFIAFFNRLTIYIIILLLIGFNSRARTLSEKEKLLIRMYSYFLLVYCIFFKVNLVASRLDVYFRAIEIILVPNLIYGLKGKYFYKSAPFILIIVIGLNFYWGINYYKNIQMFLYQGNYYTNKVYEYPYISVFNKDKIYEKSNYSYHEIVNKRK